MPPVPHTPSVPLPARPATYASFCTFSEVVSNSTDQYSVAPAATDPRFAQTAPTGDPVGQEMVVTVVGSGVVGVMGALDPFLNTTLEVPVGRESTTVTSLSPPIPVFTAVPLNR